MNLTKKIIVILALTSALIYCGKNPENKDLSGNNKQGNNLQLSHADDLIKLSIKKEIDKARAEYREKNYLAALTHIKKAVLSGEKLSESKENLHILKDLFENKYNILRKLDQLPQLLEAALSWDKASNRASERRSSGIAKRIALLYLRLENIEKAFEWLNISIIKRGYKDKDTFQDDIFNPIRKDLRFTELMKGIEANIGIGKPAIDFTVPLLSGEMLSISSLKGKVVLIDFWAVWCGPCVRSIPGLKKVYSRFKEKDFEIIGISLDKSKIKLLEFIKKNNINWKISCSEREWEDELVINKYKINSIPSTWLVDKKGILRHYDLNESNFEKAIESLIIE